MEVMVLRVLADVHELANLFYIDGCLVTIIRKYRWIAEDPNTWWRSSDEYVTRPSVKARLQNEMGSSSPEMRFPVVDSCSR